ncbi:MAG TPA: DUF3418 domain-containing protein, partial [Bacteroidia bacterium]|nr:DUF3418 domain-containing protein [Bacteroidia bacterium]
DTGEDRPAMRLWPSETCALRQHRLGTTRLYRVVRKDRIDRLLAVLFAGKAPSTPIPAKTQKSAPKKDAAFNSLAAAFGEVGRPSPPQTSSPAPAAKFASQGRFLAAAEAFLLSRIGPGAAQHKEDLLRRILVDLLGEPFATGEWESAAVRCDARLFEHAGTVCEAVAKILRVAETVTGLLGNAPRGYEESIADARRQLDRLLAPGWLLADDLARTLLHFQGLEMRLTRMLGAPPAKDLQKLERYEAEAAAIWRDTPACECGQCPPAIQHAAALAADCDLRLKHFAPELRARLR